MASRAELVSRELRPALESGTIVLLDRFFLSTYAYQIAGRGLDEGDVRVGERDGHRRAGARPDDTAHAARRRRARSAPRGAARRIAWSAPAASFTRGSKRRSSEFADARLAGGAPGVRCHRRASTPAATPDAVEALVLDAVASRFHELRARARSGRVNRARALMVTVILTGAAVAGGWLMQRALAPQRARTARRISEAEGAKLFDAVMQRVEDSWVDSASAEDLYERATSRARAAARRPEHRVSHARPPAPAQGGGERQLSAASGMSVDARDGWITVLAPRPGSPAERAGLRAGDRLVEDRRPADEELDAWRRRATRFAVRSAARSSSSSIAAARRFRSRSSAATSTCARCSA